MSQFEVDNTQGMSSGRSSGLSRTPGAAPAVGAKVYIIGGLVLLGGVVAIVVMSTGGGVGGSSKVVYVECSAEQNLTGCLGCTSASSCQACEGEGKWLEAGKCMYNCSSDQVTDSCVTCLNADNCLTCVAGKNLAVFHGGCVDECLAANETDLAPDLKLEPEIRNGYEFQRMCVDEEDIHFFAIGDWGGFELGKNGKEGYKYPKGSKLSQGQTSAKEGLYMSPNKNAKYGSAGDTGKAWNLETKGIDGKAQKLVADQMNLLAQTRNPRFVVNVGDNFYWGGFEDQGCGGDPKAGWNNWRWTNLWSDLYDIPHPVHPEKQVPWFSVLGNHDYGGEHMDSGWDHQVYKTYDKAGTHWRMPGLWWSQEVRFRHMKIDLFMLDGNQIDARSRKPCPDNPDCWKRGNICGFKWASKSNGHCPVLGMKALNWEDASHPSDPSTPCVQWFHENWIEEMKYLEVKLAASKAQWIAVVAHYPGNCGDPQMMNMMKEYGVDMCIVGHTHQNEISQYGGGCSAASPCPGEPIQILVGGGGGIVSEGPASIDNFMYGFADVHLTRDRLTAEVVNQAGNRPSPQWNIARRPKKNLGEVPAASAFVV